MGRKKWPKKLVNDVFNKTLYLSKSDNPTMFSKLKTNHKKDKARCWHCRKTIVRGKRTSKDGKQAWHIDHYPVQYTDIENQVCCGITDQHAIENLVPSCVMCNISHHYERKHWYFCHRSQVLCTKRCIVVSFILFLVLFILVLVLVF